MLSQGGVKRNIDTEAERSYSWLGERFRLIKMCRLNVLLAMLIVAFFAGVCASIIWIRALDVYVYHIR